MCLLAKLYEEAGQLGFVGEYKAGNDGKIRWSNGAVLYRAKNIITTSGPPFDGWIVEECQVDGKKNWGPNTPKELE